MSGRGRGRAGRGLQLGSPPGLGPPGITTHDPELPTRLQQLADEIGAAGVPLASFLQLFVDRFGSTLQASDRTEYSVQNIIQK